MTINIKGLDNYTKNSNKKICLGVFDGFHKGHQVLAQQSDYMVTFSPHPSRILSSPTPIELLTLPNELIYLNNKTLFVPFTHTLAAMSAEEFLDQMISKYFSPNQITIGYDFKFGKNQFGDIKFLRQWGIQNNCNIVEIPAQKHQNGTIYKSSLIRKLIKDDVNLALEYLGHPYIMSGTIIKGDGRGKALGFPTANCAIPSGKCVPKLGVYQSSILIDETLHSSISYIGTRSTFNQTTPIVETHILDGFSKSIYGKGVIIELQRFIRDDIKFESKEALIGQIQHDIASL